jgi:serine/threonine-protein kinase
MSKPGDGAASTEAWIDLEPVEDGSGAGVAALRGAELRFGAGASAAAETHELRRQRLGLVALFLTLVYGVFAIWNAIAHGTHFWDLETPYIVRFAIAALVAAIALSGVRLSRAGGRGLEIVLFGGLTFVLCVAQYRANLGFLEDGELLGAVAYMKNGVIQCVILMLLYGMVMPNSAREAAGVVMTMALALASTYCVLLTHPAVAPIVGALDRGEPVGTDFVILGLGAFLAIYGAHVINGLRRDLHAARRFGQYELGRKIGAGGMGEVYLAEHQMLKRPCALKLIRPEMADALALARFEREVRSAARLAHPNTIEIFDYGRTEDGTFYYVMEYLIGMSLDELVERHGPLDAGRTIYLLRQACAGLAEAHRIGLVHRDLKPANLYVSLRGGDSDVLKVLDFGLVKLADDPAEAQLTADRTVSGTPLYMSPEQARAEDLDQRSDIYSLGAIGYFAVTGRPPFVGGTAMEVMIAHARDTAARPSAERPGVPADLEGVILKCLAKEPGARFQSMTELSEALGRCAAAGDWDNGTAEAWWREAAERSAGGSQAMEAGGVRSMS